MDNQENVIIPNTPKDVFPQKDIVPEIRRYTNITNAFCDCPTLRILRSLFSGRFGEMTTFNTLLFQRLISDRFNPALATALREIALEDFLHMELLGNAIISFGGVPRFTNGQGGFWSARNINYNTNVNDFLRYNILGKERSIREYERAISRVTNESLRQLFREIIEDERRHIDIFRGFIN